MNRYTAISKLAGEYVENNVIAKDKYDKYDVKRGLRNADGTGVMAGLTLVCNVHGYIVRDGERTADEGILTYRGIDISQLIKGCENDGRFGFEETVWLLIFGKLPTREQYEGICELIYDNRELPGSFVEDMIIKAPSPNIMNKLARSVLALYSYDENPDDLSLENNIKQSISLIARLPAIMSYAYQVKRRHYDKETMFFHQFDPSHSTAQFILSSLRPDRTFTREEAQLLDLCLILHAEHGGGNNSTFVARVLTSSETDIYCSIGGAIGSLKGFRHGGANHKVQAMMDDIMKNVKNWGNEDEVYSYLMKIIRKTAGDKSGLLYGMGHAIYTLSDPRAVILKEKARSLAKEKGYSERLALYELVEKLAPVVFAQATGYSKVISANVDFYSGLVYDMLGIPPDLFTPLFAVSRIAGWCAHRIEELATGGRIIRPAYKALEQNNKYVPMDSR